MSYEQATAETIVGDRSTTNVLPFVVGFYFAFRSFILVLAVHLLGTDPRTGTGINLACGYCLLLLVAFCSLGDSQIRFGELMHPVPVRWAFLFLAFTALSLLWSGTPSMSSSIAYWCAMAADVAMVVMLVRAGPLATVTDQLMQGYVWGASAVAVIAWILPAQSDLRLGDEGLLGANQVGYLCGFAFFFAQYLMRERRAKFGVQSVLLAVTLLRTLSKTTIAAFMVSQGFLLITDKSISRRNKLLAVFVALIAVGALWGLLTAYFSIYTTEGNQSTTLTGRIGIWAYFVAEALEKPWLGHGFDSVWNVVPPFGVDEFEPAHAHNELLQQFYAYGLAGICLFAGVYASVFLQIRKLAHGPLRKFFLAFLLFVLVRGGADTERFDLSLPMWTVIMISLLTADALAAGKVSERALRDGPLPLVFAPQHPPIPEKGAT